METIGISVTAGPSEEAAGFFDAVLGDLLQATDLEQGVLFHVDSERVRLIACAPDPTESGALPQWVHHGVSVVEGNGFESSEAFTADSTEGRTLVLARLRSEQETKIVFVSILGSGDDAERALAALTLASVVLDRADLAMRTAEQSTRINDLVQCLDLTLAVNEHPKYIASAMTLCNEIAHRWSARRVSLGMISRNYLRIAAMSNTDHVQRRSQIADEIEQVMEECFDQDTEVFAPSLPDELFVNREARRFADSGDSRGVCSLPLRVAGEAVGVLTIERDAGQPLSLSELARLRVACDMTAVRLRELQQRDRWVGARLATWANRIALHVAGPHYTWPKVIVAVILAGLFFGLVIPGYDRVDSSFVVEPASRRVVPAPFQGFIEQVHVQPGDPTIAGETPLMTLETSQLRLELARQVAAKLRYEAQSDIARTSRDQAAVQIARAEAAAASAEIAWLEDRIRRATITAPIDGVVLRGDHGDRVGGPVDLGEMLFEVGLPDQVRAELRVPDDRITQFKTGIKGDLASASHPGKRIGYLVEYIHPVAEVVENENVFRVRVTLDKEEAWLAPGVEGLAKTRVGTKPLLVLWTRDAINWVRMRLWI